jgi:hypothetical protein
MTEYGRKDTLSFETKNLVHPQGKHDCLWVHFCLSRPQRFEFVRQTDSKCFLPSARTLGADVCTAKLPHLRYEDGTSWGIRMLTRAIVDPNDLAQDSAQVTSTTPVISSDQAQPCYLNWRGNASISTTARATLMLLCYPENNRPSMTFTLLYLKPPPNGLPRSCRNGRHHGVGSS